MTNTKSIWRWVGEALLVFASVLGAFLVEDYRHNKQEKGDYISTLTAFRNNVHEHIGDFRSTYDPSVNTGNPILFNQIEILFKIDSILSDKSLSNDTVALRLYWQTVRFPDLRYESIFMRPITQYSQYILADSLFDFLAQYEHIMSLEYESYSELNRNYENFNTYLYEYFDPYNPADPINLKAVNSIRFRNTIRQSINLIESLINEEIYNVRTFSEAITQIDQKLHQHGVDTSTLNRENLIR